MKKTVCQKCNKLTQQVLLCTGDLRCNFCHFLTKTKAKKAVETPQAQSFSEKLLSLKGIGKKTVEDILKIFPTQKDLTLAIKNGEHLPFRNDFVKILEGEFK